VVLIISDRSYDLLADQISCRLLIGGSKVRVLHHSPSLECTSHSDRAVGPLTV